MAKTDTPPSRLSEILQYDPQTGLLHWKIRTRGYGGLILPGDVAGTLKDGYVNLKIDGTFYRAHRLAWFMMTGDWLPPSQDIDHINGIRHDNRWTNLRLATRVENNRNAGMRRNNKSGFRGVSFRKDTGKWHARITVDYQVILLGNYPTLEAAAAAREAAERKYFGAHSYLLRS